MSKAPQESKVPQASKSQNWHYRKQGQEQSTRPLLGKARLVFTRIDSLPHCDKLSTRVGDAIKGLFSSDPVSNPTFIFLRRQIR